MISQKGKKITKNLGNMREKADKTRDISISNDRCISFAQELTCFSSAMSFLLDDTEDVKIRIKKASKSMGALDFTWSIEDSPIETKVKKDACAPLIFFIMGRGELKWQ